MQDDCLKVLEQIELYLDGELDAGVSLGIDEHLEACKPCMDRSEFQRHLKEMLRAKCGCDEVPPHVLERVRSVLGDPSLGEPSG